MTKSTTYFAPQLILKELLPAVEFYKKAFGATVLRKWEHEGRLHVAELEISGALFHLHEEVAGKSQLSPESAKGASVLIGLFVDDVHATMKNAEQSGAKVTGPVEDYDYGYRQGHFTDPFGHQWMIEKKI